MNDSGLIERITRSLAFMLRHQPERFDLEVDAYGFASLDDVVRALNERLGEPVTAEDVEEAVSSGDRVRYEIQDDRIRALYGHSIAVEPGSPSKPPEVLFVAIPAGELERAQRYGLRGGRRRFLHLAGTLADAREAGRRAARRYAVLSIQALDAWEEGVNFYDRHSLWLAEEVPTHLLEVEDVFEDGTDPLPQRSSGRSEGRQRSHQGRERPGGERGGRRERGRGRRGERERVPEDDEPRRAHDDELDAYPRREPGPGRERERERAPDQERPFERELEERHDAARAEGDDHDEQSELEREEREPARELVRGPGRELPRERDREEPPLAERSRGHDREEPSAAERFREREGDPRSRRGRSRGRERGRGRNEQRTGDTREPRMREDARARGSERPERRDERPPRAREDSARSFGAGTEREPGQRSTPPRPEPPRQRPSRAPEPAVERQPAPQPDRPFGAGL